MGDNFYKSFIRIMVKNKVELDVKMLEEIKKLESKKKK